MAVLPTELCPLSDDQAAIVDLCRGFAATEIRPRARAVDEADTEIPWDLWEKAAAVGITSLMLPAEYGGGGFTDVFTQCLVQEELCVGDLGIGNLLSSGGVLRRSRTGAGDGGTEKGVAVAAVCRIAGADRARDDGARGRL